MKDKFIRALESNNINELKELPKSDLHNHATKGGSRNLIESILSLVQYVNLFEISI